MKKIVITKTNNDASSLFKNEFVFKTNSLSYLTEFYSFILKHGFEVKKNDEFSDIKYSLAWVTSQWKHDGMNEPTQGASGLDILKSVYQDKKQFRCVEYGIVLSDVLQSIGFITRTVALRSKNVSYGGFGQGHVAMEVWSNDFRKWLFLDPQFGNYLTVEDNKIPLSYYEVFLQKKNRLWKKIKVHSALKKLSTKEQDDYKKFLKDYFGHMSVSRGKDQPLVSLHLESKDFPITFQGLQTKNVIFTDDDKILYPEMNVVSILLQFSGEQANFSDQMKRYSIQTESDYLKYMDKFAALPNFDLFLDTNTPFHKGYEYRLGPKDEWHFIKTNQIPWSAKNTMNFFEVRAVNEFDRRGPSTYIEISYK